MKIELAVVLFAGISLSQGEAVFSQTAEKEGQSNRMKEPEEEHGPMIFKFEPDYMLSEEDRKQQILKYRAVIDTMTISDRKRRALLKDLYKNERSTRLSKALMTDPKSQDIE